VRSLNSHGVVAIRDREVSEADVQHVVDAAKAVAIPADQKILHVLPQEFIIDGQEGIRDPIGMSGVRLRPRCTSSPAPTAPRRTSRSASSAAASKSTTSCSSSSPSSFACLTDDEKELGVCIIDIGGGTTDLAVFSQGAIAIRR
jgi:cell division protein FtsA